MAETKKVKRKKFKCTGCGRETSLIMDGTSKKNVHCWHRWCMQRLVPVEIVDGGGMR